MKRALSLLVLSLPAVANAWTVEGVDMDAVPWAELCPSVEAIELKTSTGTCAVTHPASKRHARWNGFGMGVEEPKPKCDQLEKEYRKLTEPKLVGGKPSPNPGVTWGFCKAAFGMALKHRAREPDRYAEPLDQWRQRFFAGYIVNEG